MSTVRHEVEVDTKLAELWAERQKLHAQFDMYSTQAKSQAGAKSHYVTKTRREWSMTLQEAEAVLAQDIAASDPDDEYGYALVRGGTNIDQIKRTVEKLAETREAIAANEKACEPLNAEYETKPWSRFFLVNNRGGHIHSTMACHSCRITTSFAWLPDMSGLTEKDAVEAYGPHLCSKCFPSAPVEWTLKLDHKFSAVE